MKSSSSDVASPFSEVVDGDNAPSDTLQTISSSESSGSTRNELDMLIESRSYDDPDAAERAGDLSGCVAIIGVVPDIIGG